jgi:hypothetical protein
MPTLSINGQSVQVDDGFLSLPSDQQNATVDEIAKSLPTKPPVVDESTGGRVKAMAAKAIEPITSYPATEAQMARESAGQVATGVGQIASGIRSAVNPNAAAPAEPDNRPEWLKRAAPTNDQGLTDIFKGAGNTAMGAAGYLGAPINAALRTFVGKPIEENTGIPKEYPEFAAGLVLPIPGAKIPTSVVQAPEVTQSAARIGVDLPKAIATENPLTKFLGQFSAKMPGGGPMLEATGNAVRQTGEAVERGASLAGGVADAQSAGSGFKTAINDSFKPAIKATVGRAYDEVERLTNPNVTTPLSSTQGTIADIVARRQASGEDAAGKAVETALGGATRPGGLTFQGVKDLRTRVGEMLDTSTFPEGMSQAELRRIYGSLTDDLKTAAMNAGGRPAVDALEAANTLNANVARWKEQLGKVLGSDRSGEAVTAAIIRAASEKGGDARALLAARSAVPAPVWQDMAATAVGRLGLDRKGEFSPAIFLNDYAALSDRGKQLLFGSIGSGDLIGHLDDIARVSQKFVDAGKLANTSGTAGHSALYTALGGAGVGLAHASFIEPITALSSIVGNNVLARALAKPASAAAVARWARTYDTLATNPNTRSLGAFSAASRSLSSNLGVNATTDDFLRAIQGPVPAGAEGEQEQP